eukprot:10262720-Alexandrium_andersonii.AAC.1
MSASLVGSEMCIRDRHDLEQRWLNVHYIHDFDWCDLHPMTDIALETTPMHLGGEPERVDIHTDGTFQESHGEWGMVILYTLPGGGRSVFGALAGQVTHEQAHRYGFREAHSGVSEFCGMLWAVQWVAQSGLACQVHIHCGCQPVLEVVASSTVTSNNKRPVGIMQHADSCDGVPCHHPFHPPPCE